MVGFFVLYLSNHESASQKACAKFESSKYSQHEHTSEEYVAAVTKIARIAQGSNPAILLATVKLKAAAEAFSSVYPSFFLAPDNSPELTSLRKAEEAMSAACLTADL